MNYTPSTTGGGPWFTCFNCAVRYPQGCVHYCSSQVTNISGEPKPATWGQLEVLGAK